MSSPHTHSQPHIQSAHNHRFDRSWRPLTLAFATQLIFFVVELVGGLLINSLVLIADAGHMLSDVAALGLSLLALYYTQKPHTAQKTYGYHRLEILVALVNGLVLWGMSGYILYEAYSRFSQPPAVASLPLMIIAGLGLMVNLFGVVILHPTKDQSINVRSAFLHLLADSLGSVAALAAGLAIYLRGWDWFDPLAAAAVAVLIVIGSWQLVWEAADILMEGTPRHIDLAEVARALEAWPGVDEIHDLHVWSISSGLFAMSVHVVVENFRDRDCLTEELEELLFQRFGLEHTTIQLEGENYHNPRYCSLTPPPPETAGG
jgi:cobalt-zinc-cadmium efflux system protein|uniref:Cation transporter n=1 Tax=Desulfobacca acetoxidans TaxID=60893 RepID=A0A7V6A680_9BACT